jgi:hypothetical protein
MTASRWLQLSVGSLVLLVLGQGVVQGRTAHVGVTFYVSPQGNDAWSGRKEQPTPDGQDGPFRTLVRARDAVRQLRSENRLKGAALVLLRGGRYELAEPLVLSPADSGRADSPTRFAAYPGEKPILSGGRLVTGWKPASDGLWTASVAEKADPSWTIPHLAVNGVVRQPSRLPKQGTFTIAGLAGADPKAKYNTPADRFEFSAEQFPVQDKHLDQAEVIVLHFWVAGNYRITRLDEKARIVYLDRKSKRRFTEAHGPAPARYYLRNVYSGLSEPGTFFHDRHNNHLLYRPTRGENLATAEVVMPRLDALVKLEGDPLKGQYVEYVRFEGLTLADTQYTPALGNAVDEQAASSVPGAIRLRGARHCLLRDCQLVRLGGYGIEVGEGCRHNTLMGNHLSYLGAGGIKINGGNASSRPELRTGDTEVTDNHLHHLGTRFHAGVGVLLMHADRNWIAYNHIHHLYYTGISVGWVWGYAPSVSRDNRIEYNRIHNIGQGLLSDMGGIYTLGVSPGTVVRHNVIHDVESFNYGGWGIYTDEGSTGIVIENNLVYRTKSGGFHQHYGKDNVIRNNIFALARTGQLIRSRSEPHRSFTIERNLVYFDEGNLFGSNWKDGHFRIDHNLYWRADGKPITTPLGDWAKWQAAGHDVHSRLADPRFRDPKKGDFFLLSDSPALELGFKPFDPCLAGPRKPAQRGG